MTELKVFAGLPIPADFAATMKYAVLAKSNGGKTYLTLKFEEQMCDAGMCFVTLDPVGKHWALRAGRDGSEKGGKPDVWVLGGQHGDVELSPTSGALIADTVVGHPGRYVLDVSGFESDAEQDRFAKDFAVRLFRRKAKDPGYPLLLILEEAESFIPQQPRPNQAAMLGAFGRIARQGRNHGLGLWMVAQRSAALNKGVLSQADVLIAKQMSHNRDLAAVDDWVESNGTREQRDELMGSLASLAMNEAWVWSPNWLGSFARTKVLKRVTFDSSANVRHGEVAQSVRLKPLDVEALGKAIAETQEREKENDPAELRKRVVELERQNEGLKREVHEANEVQAVEVVREVPTVPEGFPAKVEDIARALSHAASAWRKLEEMVGVEIEQAGSALEDIDGLREGLVSVREAAERPPTALGQHVAKAGPIALRSAVEEHFDTALPVRSPERSVRPAIATNGKVTLGKAERAILSVLATHGTRSTRQLALQTGYSAKGGGFRNALGKLRNMEPEAFIVGTGEAISLTPVGAEHAQAEPLPRGQELLGHWVSQVGKAEGLILNCLAVQGPLPVEVLASLTGYEPSGGGFRNALGKLRTLELINRGKPIALTDEFAAAIA